MPPALSRYALDRATGSLYRTLWAALPRSSSACHHRIASAAQRHRRATHPSPVPLHTCASASASASASAPALRQQHRHQHGYHSSTSPSSASYEAATIFALASGRGAAGIAVIRISGPAVGAVYRRICRPPASRSSRAAQSQRKRGDTPLPPSHKLVLRDLHHPHSDELLDHAAVIYFPSGHSYTGEEVLELHVHGGPATVRDTLDALGDLALPSTAPSPSSSPPSSSTAPSAYHHASLPPIHIRPALPGEFTRRAYSAGLIDLTSSEALHSLITSSTASQRRLALQGSGGLQTQRYEAIRSTLLEAMAMIEAIIDFSDEEGVDPGAWNTALRKVEEMKAQIERELGIRPDEVAAEGSSSERDGRAGIAAVAGTRRHVGEILSSGVRLAIYGPPNAGKSSLLNALADREAAIVSDVPGTTRDVVQVDLELGGFKVVAYDTAGIRAEREADTIERIGIERAREAVEAADLALLVFPCTQADTPASERPQLPTLRPESYAPDDPDLVFLSKSDLLPSHAPLSPSTERTTIYRGSAKTASGLSELLTGLTALLDAKYAHHLSPASAAETPLITQARHRFHLLECREALVRFVLLARDGGSQADVDVVLAAEELRVAAKAVGKVTGVDVTPDEVLGQVFGKFCIGK